MSGQVILSYLYSHHGSTYSIHSQWKQVFKQVIKRLSSIQLYYSKKKEWIQCKFGLPLTRFLSTSINHIILKSKSNFPKAMGKLKRSAIFRTTSEYADNSSVHGVKYAFEKVLLLSLFSWQIKTVWILAPISHRQNFVDSSCSCFIGCCWILQLWSLFIIWTEQGCNYTPQVKWF